MDSNRYFARVKRVNCEGDIYFSNRIRPIPIDLAFSMEWPAGDIVLTKPARLSRRMTRDSVSIVLNFLLPTVFTANKPQRVSLIWRVLGVDQRCDRQTHHQYR